MSAHVLTLGLTALVAGLAVAAAQAQAPVERAGPPARPPLLMPGAGQPAPRLLATFGHPDPARALAVVTLGDAPATTLRTGQAIGDFELLAIGHEHIVVGRGTQHFTVPLTGRPRQARTAIAKPAAMQRLRDAGPGMRVPATATSTAATTLAAGSLDDVRAACGNPTLMASLPSAQREELAALGVCPPP